MQNLTLDESKRWTFLKDLFKKVQSSHKVCVCVYIYMYLLLFTLCGLVAKSCLTLCDPVDCSTPASLSFTVFCSLLKLLSIELVMLPIYLTLCYPLLWSSVFPSIKDFSECVGSSHQVTKILLLFQCNINISIYLQTEPLMMSSEMH